MTRTLEAVFDGTEKKIMLYSVRPKIVILFPWPKA